MAASDDLMASGPTISTTDSSFSYLGVPKNFTTQAPIPAALGVQAPPRYKTGDQYLPQRMSPELITQIQVQLDRAGLYKKSDSIIKGRWDETTATAYAQLLKYANRGGWSAEEALQAMGTLTPDQRSEAGLPLGGVTGTGTTGSSTTSSRSATDPLFSVDNPDDLRTLADRTARASLGHSLSQQELSHFVTAYQDAQVRAQQATLTAGPNARVATAPDASSFMKTQAESADPTAAEAVRQVDIFKTIAGALGGIRS